MVRHRVRGGFFASNGCKFAALALSTGAGVCLLAFLNSGSVVRPTRDVEAAEAFGQLIEAYIDSGRNMSARIESAEHALLLFRQQQRKIQMRANYSLRRLNESLQEARTRVMRIRYQQKVLVDMEKAKQKDKENDAMGKEKGDEEEEDDADDDSGDDKKEEARSKKCLVPYVGGCNDIRVEKTCLGSMDGRSEMPLASGLRIHGEPCVWCGGKICTATHGKAGLTRCEPKEWLLNGEGVAFEQFLAKDNFTIAGCKEEKPGVQDEESDREEMAKMLREHMEQIQLDETAGTFRRWRTDGRCGESVPQLPDGTMAECGPSSGIPCCQAKTGICGNTTAHCNCKGCENYFKAENLKLEVAAQGFQCKAVGADLGVHKTPNLCAEKAISMDKCGTMIMFSPKNAMEWGCRCCSKDNRKGSANKNWNLVSFKM